jgi:hypothetical protein
MTSPNGTSNAASISASISEPGRIGPPRRRPGLVMGLLIDVGWLLLVSLVLLVTGTGVFGAAPHAASQERTLAGWLGLVLVFAIAPITVRLRRQARSAGSLAARIEMLTASMRTIADQAGLSDDARRVLNRSTERELLCRSIEQDIANQDWDAGLVLCSELADRFGYRAEAEQFRARIEAARSQVQDRRIFEAIGGLDSLIVQRRWDDALREAGRIRRLFPDSPRTETLRLRVDQARAIYKQDIAKRFRDAADAGRTDEAMELLKELDLYLSPDEAEPLKEMAKNVITRTRERLGEQFKQAVHERQWPTAQAIGRRIISEFPNTRMAQEVRQVLDGIANRGTPAATAESNV